MPPTLAQLIPGRLPVAVNSCAPTTLLSGVNVR